MKLAAIYILPGDTINWYGKKYEIEYRQLEKHHVLGRDLWIDWKFKNMNYAVSVRWTDLIEKVTVEND